MRARQRSLRNMQWAAHRCSQHLGGHVVSQEYLDELPYDCHSIFVDVIEAPDERTDEGCAGLCREQALVCAQNEGAVRRDAFLRQPGNRFKPFFAHRNLDHDVRRDFANARPSDSIPSTSDATTSAETGPGVIVQTWARIDSYEPAFAALANRLGLVVTPSTKPHRAAMRISSMSAVSKRVSRCCIVSRRRCDGIDLVAKTVTDPA
jgi:hypothetical protein